MQHYSGRSIICDFCYDETPTDFTYYSFDFKTAHKSPGQLQLSDDVIFSADLCESCMNEFRSRILKAYKAPYKGRFACDITGKIDARPVCDFYKCYVSKVDVNFSGQPFVCSECGSLLQDENSRCSKCAEGTGVRQADVECDDAYLDINFCDEIYKDFVAHVEKMKRIADENGTKNEQQKNN